MEGYDEILPVSVIRYKKVGLTVHRTCLSDGRYMLRNQIENSMSLEAPEVARKIKRSQTAGKYMAGRDLNS